MILTELVDPECDIGVATMAQLLLHEGNVTEALKYFERAAALSRTLGEIINALQYAEATRTQLEVSAQFPIVTEPVLIPSRSPRNILNLPST
jgi:import receptor subunit TOM70